MYINRIRELLLCMIQAMRTIRLLATRRVPIWSFKNSPAVHRAVPTARRLIGACTTTAVKAQSTAYTVIQRQVPKTRPINHHVKRALNRKKWLYDRGE